MTPPNGTNETLRRPRGFTYVEILVTLCLLGMLFVPMMQLFSSAMEASSSARDLVTATCLARWDMERLKNLGGKARLLMSESDLMVWPDPMSDPVKLNGRHWRIDRKILKASEPMEVTVGVRRDEDTRPLVQITTLLTDTTWERPQTPGP